LLSMLGHSSRGARREEYKTEFLMGTQDLRTTATKWKMGRIV